jgi:hypothetical protein
MQTCRTRYKQSISHLEIPPRTPSQKMTVTSPSRRKPSARTSWNTPFDRYRVKAQAVCRDGLMNSCSFSVPARTVSHSASPSWRSTTTSCRTHFEMSMTLIPTDLSQSSSWTAPSVRLLLATFGYASLAEPSPSVAPPQPQNSSPPTSSE